MRVCTQLGENGSSVRPAEFGAAAGTEQHGARLPPAAGAEDSGSQAGGAVPPLLEGELPLHCIGNTQTAQFLLVGNS